MVWIHLHNIIFIHCGHNFFPAGSLHSQLRLAYSCIGKYTGRLCTTLFMFVCEKNLTDIRGCLSLESTTIAVASVACRKTVWRASMRERFCRARVRLVLYHAVWACFILSCVNATSGICSDATKPPAVVRQPQALTGPLWICVCVSIVSDTV